VAKSASRKAPGAARKVSTKRVKGKTAEVPGPAVAELDAPAPAGAEQDPSDEDIRVRAYFRYLERGGTHGASFDDWAEAKKELKQKR
jgi:hypothetical protein